MIPIRALARLRLPRFRSLRRRWPPARRVADKNLLGPTNDAAKHISTAAFTFFVACVFIGISVASTTHERLLTGADFKLPIFGVTIWLELFYSLAPLLVLLLHLHLLVLEHLLACKIARLPDELVRDGVAAHFPPALHVNVLLYAPHAFGVRILLRLLLFAFNVLLPQALLIFIQIRFLPCHRYGFTGWHQGLLLIDVVMVFYFYWLTTNELQQTRRRRDALALGGQLVWIAVLGFYSVVVLAVPGTWGRCGDKISSLLANGFDLNISAHRRLNGVKLAGWDLRNADFTDCGLANADFSDADLEGANFTGADLRGANLSGADLDHATFSGANLRNAELRKASIRRGILDDARMEGANLAFADLTGARFLGAYLSGASMRGVYLLGANLDRAVLRAADVSGAQLQGASFAEAVLDAAELKGAGTVGANFRKTFLRGAANLELDGVVLRGSRVAGLARCSLKHPTDSLLLNPDPAPPYLTDLRELDFKPVPPKVLEGQQKSVMRDVLPGPLQAEALKRLAAVAFNRPPCLVSRPSSLSHRGVLYDERDRKGHMARWPLTQELALPLPRGQVWGEPTFYKKLARHLIEQACQDEHLATAMAFKVASPHLSVDPDLRRELERWLRGALKNDFVCAEREVLVAVVCELGKQERFLPKSVRCPET